MIVGTGVDIVKVQRIESALNRWGDNFAAKILTVEELGQYHHYKSGRAGYLARQFAAKEAVAKALGTGMGAGTNFLQIAVGRIDSGAPVVSLLGRAKIRSEKLGVNSWHVSISDEKEFTVAFVVAENSPDNKKNDEAQVL
jgi:holo-[acyl-carrier protein] synthase